MRVLAKDDSSGWAIPAASIAPGGKITRQVACRPAQSDLSGSNPLCFFIAPAIMTHESGPPTVWLRIELLTLRFFCGAIIADFCHDIYLAIVCTLGNLPYGTIQWVRSAPVLRPHANISG